MFLSELKDRLCTFNVLPIFKCDFVEINVMKVFAHNCFIDIKITEFLPSIDVIPVRMGLHGLNKFRSSIALMARTSHSRSLAPIMVFTVFTLFTNLIHSQFSPLSFSCFFISSFYCALIQLPFPTNSSVTNTSNSH